MVTHGSVLPLPVDCKGTVCVMFQSYFMFLRMTPDNNMQRHLHLLKCNYVKQFGN